MAYDIELEYAFDAAPATVFDGFLDMYGPDRPDWILDSALDLRVGGRWTVTFQPPGIEAFREERTLTEVDRPHTLAYDLSNGVQVRFRFEEMDTGTRLRLTESGFATEEQRDEFAGAWPDVFAELAGRI